jgi:hypothetical protein
MALNRKTPKQTLRYWRVGWNGVVIKARTARVAVRKWLRDNAVNYLIISNHELDNPHGTGDMPNETAAYKRWRDHERAAASRLEVKDVKVVEVPKGTPGPSAPKKGSFWSRINKR